MNTFHITYVMNIHLAGGNTFAAVYTLVLFKLDSKDGELVEKTVNSTKRADKSTECAVDKYTGNDDADRKQEFPCKQRSES